MHLALRYRSDSYRIIDTILEEFEGIETIPTMRTGYRCTMPLGTPRRFTP
jgi:hypothetical protein